MRNALIALLALVTLMVVVPGCLPADEEDGVAEGVDIDIAPQREGLLTDVSFADLSLGLVSGWGGTLLRTNDGGDTWVAMRSNTRADLNSVEFLNDNIAIAVGAGGKILRSVDEGRTWEEQQSPTTETLNKIVSLGEEKAYAAGWNGTLIRTDDAGVTWQARTIDPPNNYISIDFSEDTGMMVTSGGDVYRSVDGGAWTALQLPEGVTPMSVSLTGDTDALLVGEFGEVLASINQGTDWLEADTVLDSDLLSSAYIGKENALAGGWDGVMIRSSDGGSTWSTVDSGADAPIRMIDVLGPNTAFAIGDGYTIIRSRDGGFNWKSVYGGPG